jgi:hypothetical protein
MSMALRPMNWLLRGILFQACLVACSASDGDDTPIPTTTGGTTGTGGTSPTTGGAVSTGGFASSGGVPNTGTGGATGGSISNPTGGTNTGGISTGGTTTGGFGTGGTSNGGTSAGGGTKANGGSSTGGSSSGGKSSGGASSGGSSSGGAKATGGTSSGGTTGGAKATGGTGTGGTVTNTGAGPTMKCGCLASAGEYGSNPIGSTIVVKSGEVFDGQCKTFRASNALGDGSQAEGQKPIFELSGGGTIQNVIIGNSAADGIHIEEGSGTANLKNVHWLDIGEDAMSMGSDRSGTPTISVDCGSSAQGSDKTFQVNSPSNWVFKNFTAKTAGKFMRQNGDSTFKMSVTIDHCDIADMSEAIYRTDSSSSTVSMTNTRYHNIGKALFIFGSTNVNGDTHNQVGTFTGNVSY